MAMNLYDVTVPTFVRMLKNLRSWLDKGAAFAEAKKFDPSVLSGLRLAPDMLPFTAQIMIAADHAKAASARLAGVDVPRYEDNEKTIAELQARIDKTLAFLETISRDKLVDADTRPIAFMAGKTERKFATGVEYVTTYAFPNFFFHVTTAYAILRNAGVDLGKADYLAGGMR